VSHPLESETTIGRAAGCRISVDDTHVSKVHARVFVNEGRWYVEDLGSTNGTLVNETLVGATTPLDVGDRIRVGETVLELQ
jgi:pSer/pThr/pTyr-binding forkhead associated (FHA) protein